MCDITVVTFLPVYLMFWLTYKMPIFDISFLVIIYFLHTLSPEVLVSASIATSWRYTKQMTPASTAYICRATQWSNARKLDFDSSHPTCVSIQYIEHHPSAYHKTHQLKGTSALQIPLSAFCFFLHPSMKQPLFLVQSFCPPFCCNINLPFAGCSMELAIYHVKEPLYSCLLFFPFHWTRLWRQWMLCCYVCDVLLASDMDALLPMCCSVSVSPEQHHGFL